MKRNGKDVRPDDPNDRIYIAQREYLLADNILLHNGDVIRYNGSTIVFRCPEDHSIDAECDEVAAFELGLRRGWLKTQAAPHKKRRTIAHIKCILSQGLKSIKWNND